MQENVTQYRQKFDQAEAILGNRFGYYRPAGGFFLWLDVGDGIEATKHLWQQAGVRVLPGQYLSRTDETGYNPGAAYIRVALVQSADITSEALSLINETL